MLAHVPLVEFKEFEWGGGFWGVHQYGFDSYTDAFGRIRAAKRDGSEVILGHWFNESLILPGMTCYPWTDHDTTDYKEQLHQDILGLIHKLSSLIAIVNS